MLIVFKNGHKVEWDGQAVEDLIIEISVHGLPINLADLPKRYTEVSGPEGVLEMESSKIILIDSRKKALRSDLTVTNLASLEKQPSIQKHQETLLDFVWPTPKLSSTLLLYPCLLKTQHLGLIHNAADCYVLFYGVVGHLCYDPAEEAGPVRVDVINPQGVCVARGEETNLGYALEYAVLVTSGLTEEALARTRD